MNYTPVAVDCPPEKCGEIVRVRITAALNGTCLGELI